MVFAVYTFAFNVDICICYPVKKGIIGGVLMSKVGMTVVPHTRVMLTRRLLRSILRVRVKGEAK
jgi:hypothetical protein